MKPRFFVIFLCMGSVSSKFSILKNSINLNQTSRLDVRIYPELLLDVVCILSGNEESEKNGLTTALDI